MSDQEKGHENRHEKNLQLERTVFFCDAVVAIAITLLALEIKIPPTKTGHFTFADIRVEWKTFLAFFLSFISISNFWRTHHSIFAYIKKVDERLLWLNIMWLLFIILVPFTTSLVSDYFFDKPAQFFYCLNILLISILQNSIWDYASLKKDYVNDTLDEVTLSRYRVYFNLDMINGVISLVLSFFYPVLAFAFLFIKVPTMVLAMFYYRRQAVHDRRPGRRK